MSLKRVLFFILLIFAFGLKAQTLVSIRNATVLITPGYTLSNVTSFTVSGSVKNAGTTTINADVHVNVAIDTSSTSTPKYYLRSTHSYTLTNFLPGTDFPFLLSDVASNTNGYKVAGNGTTVVIWAVVGFPTNTTTTLDSAKTNLYIPGSPTGMEEKSFLENNPVYIQNPVTDQLILRYNHQEYKRVDMTDGNGKTVGLIWDAASTAIPEFMVNVCHLPYGIYYIRFYYDAGIITKKIIVH